MKQLGYECIFVCLSHDVYLEDNFRGKKGKRIVDVKVSDFSSSCLKEEKRCLKNSKVVLKVDNHVEHHHF